MKKGFFTIRLKAAVALILSLALLFSACGVSGNVSTDPTGDTTVIQQATQATTDSAVGTTEATKDTAGAQDEQSGSGETGNQQTTTQPSKGVGKGKASPVSLSSIPAFSGKPYVQVDGNTPNFSAAELTAKGYETYSSLDSLGRVGAAVASVGKDTMPGANEERGSISDIKPTGWVQAQYDCVSGKYLYNRCHLIGWQLSAENANKSNLITGTKYLNTSGMLPFENMVADYIKETGNHVAYRVSPIYSGNDLVASGVQMEAYSVEDNGDGICFNVFCYNVQPEVTIDYATGKSTGPASEDSGNTDTSGNTGSGEDGSQTVYITATGKKYHSIENCSGLSNAKAIYEATLEEALEKDLELCKKCH